MSQVDFDPQPRRTRRHDFVIQHCLFYGSLFLTQKDCENFFEVAFFGEAIL